MASNNWTDLYSHKYTCMPKYYHFYTEAYK